MNSGHKVHQFVVVLATAALSACGVSAQPRFYSLDSSAIPDGKAAVQAAVLVEPVSVPASVDQPQLVVQVAPNRVEVEEFDRWDAPLADSIARAVAGDLSILLATPNVATAPLANFNPAFTVTISVQRFQSVKDHLALIDAVWVVHKTTGKTRSGRTIAQETLQSQGFDALAVAHSQGLAKLSKDIAAAISADADEENLNSQSSVRQTSAEVEDKPRALDTGLPAGPGYSLK